MIFGEFARVLVEELGARCPVPGKSSRAVRGLALEETADGWLEADEIAVTGRKALNGDFFSKLGEAGSPGFVWRTSNEPPNEVTNRARELGVGVILLSPNVPLRKLFEIFSRSNELLLHSHGAARMLIETTGSESSVGGVAEKVSELLGCAVAVEDPVGRLIAGGPRESNRLLSALEEHNLRASKSSEIDETRRERRDRYARLPDGFLSVPVERWRVESREFFWTPIGSPISVGYLWVDLADRPLQPEDVVFLYWARRILEAELGKERIRLETELGVRGDFVDDLIWGDYGSLELLLQRAAYLGADLSKGALAMIVDVDDFARYLERRKLRESAIQELKKRLADAVRLQTQQVFSNFLLGPRSDNVILFIGASGERPLEEIPEQARTLAVRIQRYVRGLLPDLTVSVGIGRYIEDPGSLPDAYSEASVALEIGQRIYGPSSISTFEGTGTYKLLFRVLQEDPGELDSFYHETLEPVVAYDSRYGTDLVQTLTTYLRNDASTIKTAAEIFAHRHTIRYRLERIKELTGLDVDKSEDREQLTLGIKAMQLLGRHPEQTPSFSDR